jgi:hypothetical protein
MLILDLGLKRMSHFVSTIPYSAYFCNDNSSDSVRTWLFGNQPYQHFKNGKQVPLDTPFVAPGRAAFTGIWI